MKHIDWHTRLGAGTSYTYKELLCAISPSQSVTAAYILQDLLSQGIVEEKANKIYHIKI